MMRSLFVNTILALSVSLFLFSCSNDTATEKVSVEVDATGSGSSEEGLKKDTLSKSERKYVGAGSQWNISMESTTGTFELIHRVTTGGIIDMNITGTYSMMPTNFQRFEVVTATGIDAPNPGDTAYGLEISGYAFFFQPYDPTSSVITMVSAGACPVEDFNGNWVKVMSSRIDGNGDETVFADLDYEGFYGSFLWHYDQHGYDLPHVYSLVNDYDLQADSQTVTVGECSEGIAIIPHLATLYLTQSGGSIIHLETDDGSVQEEQIMASFASETLTSMSDFDGNYSSLVLYSNPTEDNIRSIALEVECLASFGGCQGSMINPQTGAIGTAVMNISFSGSSVNEPSDGFVVGRVSFDTTGSSGAISCMVDTNATGSGKTLLSCAAQEPTDNTSLFNVIMISK